MKTLAFSAIIATASLFIFTPSAHAAGAGAPINAGGGGAAVKTTGPGSVIAGTNAQIQTGASTSAFISDGLPSSVDIKIQPEAGDQSQNGGAPVPQQNGDNSNNNQNQ